MYGVVFNVFYRKLILLTYVNGCEYFRGYLCSVFKLVT
ncbi:hypothetical protein T190607A02C_70019 [Tenacibaculum sp. 190524A02b]